LKISPDGRNDTRVYMNCRLQIFIKLMTLA